MNEQNTRVELLRDVLAALEQEVTNRDGDDPLGVHYCDRCAVGSAWTSEPHSIGCRIRKALG